MPRLKPVTQKRILTVARKIQARFNDHPITQQMMLIAQSSGFVVPDTHREQVEYLEALQNLKARAQKREDVFAKRMSKLVDIQFRHDISGIVWHEVNDQEEGLSFPTFHPLLRATPSDMGVMREWKSAVVRYAIQLVIENNVVFSRTNSEGLFVELEDPNQIWTFSSYYSWATLWIEHNPFEVHLILGNGNKEDSEECIWFVAGGSK